MADWETIDSVDALVAAAARGDLIEFRPRPDGDWHPLSPDAAQVDRCAKHGARWLAESSAGWRSRPTGGE